MDFATLNGSGRNSDSLGFVFESVDGSSERQARNKSKKIAIDARIKTRRLSFGRFKSFQLKCFMWVNRNSKKIYQNFT